MRFYNPTLLETKYISFYTLHSHTDNWICVWFLRWTYSDLNTFNQAVVLLVGLFYDLSFWKETSFFTSFTHPSYKIHITGHWTNGAISLARTCERPSAAWNCFLINRISNPGPVSLNTCWIKQDLLSSLTDYTL